MAAGHTPGKRDLYKAATATMTGVVAFGALAGTGYASGVVAHQYDLDQQLKKQQQAGAAAGAQQPTPTTVARRRPHRTIVHTQVIQRATTGVTRVGSGGTITSTAPARTSSASTTRVKRPAAPAPAPPAAPSSGS